MGALFYKDEMKQFLDIIQRLSRTSDEVLLNVRQAIACVEDIIHIGKVTIDLSVPQTKLRAQVQNFSSVLFLKEGVYGYQPVAHSFRTGDGGTVVITFYAMDGYLWDEEELSEIKILSNLIFCAFRIENMNSLLDKAVTTDLSVDMPNVSGFMRFATEKFARGLLEEYIGVYFNIHNFKYVNNILPYIKADEVMGMYVNMLKKAISSEEIVARLGGDNFVALINVENIERFIAYISNINIVYQNEEDEKKFNFNATIGASKLKDISRIGEVMHRISIAYQVARQQESTEVVYYKDEYYKDVAKQKEIIAGFQRGLEQQEFVVHYQPKVMAKDKTICGGEALVRWKRQGALVYPIDFIPILERDGSICKLDFYVLDKACSLLEDCMKNGLDLPRISINFSRKHIGNPFLVKEIVKIIDRHKVPHEYVEIELTESEDFRDYIVMAKLIEALKAEGISTSIDDFGTGYSSLNMLKMTSIDILKIDKSFIPLKEECDNKKKECIMFENIAHLAKELGVMVVAEGVETESQYEYLKQMGCDIIQGYYFDKPLTPEEFVEKVKMVTY
ncbi:MAG: GGDEF domain-containing protein [Lachnospiraceae bacterium]|nr:GGDEF domain-containing protein [Lachnospiraceae bacterium]